MTIICDSPWENREKVNASGGGGGLPYETDRDARWKFLHLTPKGDHLGVA